MVAIFTSCINAAMNFFLGLILYSMVMGLIIITLFLGYYLSRYKYKHSLAIGIIALVSNFVCSITYFATEGSESVNLFTFILIIFLLSVLTTKKQFKIWIPLNLVLVASLFLLEYHYPNLVKPLYTSRNHKLIDIAQTWMEAAIMIALITTYVRNNYNREKALANNRLLELQEINNTKNKLFSIVAHDLRAPLASVENYLSLLNKIDLEPEEKKAIEQNLLASTKQTSEMLQNILHWSKDQMQGITASLTELSLDETLAHTISLQQNLAKEKNIQLNYKITNNIKVIADSDMLQLIIRNLLNNAIKFTSPGGDINLNATADTNTCTIAIEDNGIGISEEERLQVFSLKNKGTYGTQQEKGVGLGLMLAKTYTELQNGKIWFESNSIGGTTFFVNIPLAI